RWNARKTTRIGRIAMTLPAQICGQSVEYGKLSSARPSCTVYRCGLPCPNRISGQKKSFHVPWNWRMTSAEMAGSASGSMIFQNELHGVQVRAALPEQDQRPEEVIPRSLELEDDERRDGGQREREHDLPERLDRACAVELRRLLEVLRDREEVLAHEEQVRRGHEVDEDVAGEASDQVPVREHHEHGDEAQLVGHHQRAEHE